MVRAQIVQEQFDAVSAELYEASDSHDTPPRLWKNWVTPKGKGYFESFPEHEIYAGEFEIAMDPKNRPGNTWLPVFGASG